MPVETLTKKEKRQQRRRERKADRYMRKRSKDHLRDPLPDTDQLYDDFLKREELDVELAPILPGGINMTRRAFLWSMEVKHAVYDYGDPACAIGELAENAAVIKEIVRQQGMNGVLGNLPELFELTLTELNGYSQSARLMLQYARNPDDALSAVRGLMNEVEARLGMLMHLSRLLKDANPSLAQTVDDLVRFATMGKAELLNRMEIETADWRLADP